MPSSKENALLHQAIALAQSGRTEDAHALLHKITAADPSQEMAWLWLVQTETDPEQRIFILEECLRHNPSSELAKKGLTRLRARTVAESLHPAKPPVKPPPLSPLLKAAKPPRRSSCGSRTLFLLLALASGITLIVAAILFYPQWKVYFPSLNLPDDPLALLRSPATATFTPTISQPATATRTRTLTATRTPTQTNTFTPTLTPTPTVTLTPTLFQGAPGEEDIALLFAAAGRCEVLRIPISGGDPESLTKAIPPDCSDPEISPDGKKMVFVSLPEGNTIQIVNADGTWKHMLAKLAASTGAGRTIGSLEWAPDGQQIAYTASAFTKDPQGKIQISGSSAFLYTVSLSSGYSKQMKALGIDALLSKRIAWSPDGMWVFAFDMGNPLESDSYPYAFRASDSRTVWIAQEDPYLGHYDWSPDSLYLSSLVPAKPATGALPADAPQDQNYIILSGLDETKHYIALEEKGYDPACGARWFPDRSAFLLFRKTANRLEAVTTEGEFRNAIVTLDTMPSFVSWSPGGEWIAIVEPESVEGAGGTLMIVRPDGSDLRILARGVGDAPLVWE
jgi:hypothetical protein